MKVQQVQFNDEDGVAYGGIMIDDRYVICGCCGGVYDIEEGTIVITNKFSYWVNISDEIMD